MDSLRYSVWATISCTDLSAGHTSAEQHFIGSEGSVMQAVRCSSQESCRAQLSRRNSGKWISHLLLWHLSLYSGLRDKEEGLCPPPPTPAQAAGSYLFLNFCGSLLGDLKVLHQGRFSQEVSGGRGEARQQVVFQCFEGDFEPILLFCELWLQYHIRESQV